MSRKSTLFLFCQKPTILKNSMNRLTIILLRPKKGAEIAKFGSSSQENAPTEAMAFICSEAVKYQKRSWKGRTTPMGSPKQPYCSLIYLTLCSTMAGSLTFDTTWWSLSSTAFWRPTGTVRDTFEPAANILPLIISVTCIFISQTMPFKKTHKDTESMNLETRCHTVIFRNTWIVLTVRKI